MTDPMHPFEADVCFDGAWHPCNPANATRDVDAVTCSLCLGALAAQVGRSLTEGAPDPPATGEPPVTCYRCGKSYCYQPLDDRPGFLECVHCRTVIQWDW